MDKLVKKISTYRIGVIAGGVSSEREVSLRSGQAVYDTLVKNGINAVFVDITENNFSSFIDKNMFDFAFLALHGKFGEDGTVQKMLEEKGVLYTGSGPEASRNAIDKLVSKDKFMRAGLNVPEYGLVEFGKDRASLDFKVPCVVKPRFEGSSIGLSVVKDPKDLEPAIEQSLKLGQDVIVEEFIAGREVTVGVIDGKALPVVEIVAPEGVYDYNAKYMSKGTQYLVPAQLAPKVYRLCQKYGEKAHNALGCRGFSRTDIRVGDDGKLYVLEVNTIPGLTERSLLPMAAKNAGLDFFGLCVKMMVSSMK